MKLTPQKIKQLGILGNALTRFYHECANYGVMLRSEELRRPNIHGCNVDAVFRQEEEKAIKELMGDLEFVLHDAGFAGVTIDVTREDVAEYVKFCKAHQLTNHGNWESELTDEERGML